MAAKETNRYALFREGPDDLPKVPPPLDPSKNPFLNQVADNPSPWQEVKKKGAPAVQPSVLRVIEGPRAALAKDVFARQRTVSTSTADTSDKPYDPHENWCGVCNQKFASKVALQAHVKQSPNHKYYCNLCKRVFKDRNGLKNHVDNASGHDVFCNLCLSAFNDEWGLKNHFENNYAVGHEFVCLTCLLGFKNQGDLQQHLQTALNHTWCKSCHRRFRNQDERDAHWQSTESEFACNLEMSNVSMQAMNNTMIEHKHCLQPGCNFDGPDQATLDRHLERDHFQCIGCQGIFQSKTKLNQHIETCQLAVPCPQCQHRCAGQAQLELHLGSCFWCEECNFWTDHEGNYRVHMTKHADAKIACWGCDNPMRTFSSLINHLESGRCNSMTDPARLLLCLGRWWYSTLYMDISIHAQLRTGRAKPDTVLQWAQDGVLHPFICRQDGCGKTFPHMSSLVLHCESQACNWDVSRLNMPGLEKEFKQTCLRRDSATGKELRKLEVGGLQ